MYAFIFYDEDFLIFHRVGECFSVLCFINSIHGAVSVELFTCMML